MSQQLAVFLLILGIVAFFYYKRSQEPHRIEEILRGLRTQAELSAARGHSERANWLQEHADCIAIAESTIKRGKLEISKEEARRVRIRLLHCTSDDILDTALGIVSLSHRSVCYDAMMSFAGKYCKLQEKQI